MSSEGTCFENLAGKRKGERILPKTLSPFLPIKNSMHYINYVYGSGRSSQLRHGGAHIIPLDVSFQLGFHIFECLSV